MGKLVDCEQTVYQVLTTLGHTGVPLGVPVPDTEKYFVVDVIPQNRAINRNSLSGLVKMRCSIPAGDGPRLLTSMLDDVDAAFNGAVYKVGSRLMQFHSGVVGDHIVSDGRLFSTYSVPFHLYGEE